MLKFFLFDIIKIKKLYQQKGENSQHQKQLRANRCKRAKISSITTLLRNFCRAEI